MLFRGKPLVLPQPFGSYVMENVLFKISYPGRVSRADRGRGRDGAAPAGARTALADIERVIIETQEPGVRIIDKTGPLANPADRDHCIQYMVAIPLIFGRLTAADYEDEVAADPRIDALRAKMQVRENPTFTAEYYAADKRYIGNALQVFFSDGSATERVQVDYPIGHRRRRAEGMPVLVKKFEASVDAHFAPKQAERIKALFAKPAAARCAAGERAHGGAGDQRVGGGGVMTPAGGRRGRSKTMTEGWRRWEGEVVNAVFPLQRFLNGSDHSAVFLTEDKTHPARRHQDHPG